MVLSPKIKSLEHAPSRAGHSRNEGLRRRRRSVLAAVEGVASAWALTGDRPSNLAAVSTFSVPTPH